MKEVPTPGTLGREDSVAVRLRDEISGLSVDPSQPLIWCRSGPLAAEFELRQGEAVFGEMEPAYMAGMDSTGECLGRSLEFHLESGFLPGIRVESRASFGGQLGPEFRGLSLGWGRVAATGGEVFRWRHAYARMADHVLIDTSGGELLRLRPAFLRFGRTDTRVLLSLKGWERPDLAELLLLTWFLRAHAEGRWLRSFKKSRKRAGGDFP
jgi:hypothetical protein